MIKINQVKLPIRHTMDDLWKTVAKRLEIDSALFKEKVILKKSVDARKKPNLMFVYTVAVSLNNSDSILERFNQDHDISYAYLIQRKHSVCINTGCGHTARYC